MDQGTNGEELKLLDYLRIIRRRRWIVVAAVLVSLAASIAFSARATRIYSAHAEVLLESSADESVFDREGSASDPLLVETQVEVLKSRPVGIEARKRLGRAAAAIETVGVSQVGRTRVLRVEVESSSPRTAQRAADMFANVYIEMRRAAAVNSAFDIAEQVLQKAQEAKSKLDDIDRRLAIARTGRSPNPAEVQRLENERGPIAAQYAAFQEKYDQFQVDAQLRRGGVQLLATAALPTSPVRPAPVRNAALATLLGLLVGITAAFVADFLDDTVRGLADVAATSRGVPVLATIPAIADWKQRDRPRLVGIEDPGSIASEAYRSLRTSLQFIGLRQDVGTLLMTSPMASEGKTTTLANLAVTLSRAGRRVVCVDCDLRRPRLNEFFGLANDVGFTSVLLGDEPLSAALKTVNVGTAGELRVLPSGPLPPNPAELLGTRRVAELLQALRSDADIVLLDAPPLLPITDATVLSSRVDGVLVVATVRVTSRRHLGRALDLLRQADAATLGLVLNGAGTEGGYGGGYGYAYRYESGRHESGPVASMEALSADVLADPRELRPE